MDDIFFNRMVGYVKEGLGAAQIAIENLSKITLLVMEFVDSFKSTASEQMTSQEKHLLAVKWIDRVMFEYCDGKKLSPEVARLNSEYISRLCEVSKGQTKLNDADTRTGRRYVVKATSNASVVPTPAVVPEPVDPTPAPAPTPRRKRRAFGCMSAVA